MEANMTEQEIIEGNKLIAEFMDLPCINLKNEYKDYEQECLEALRYHSSWDWLMPVCAKIGEMYEYGEYIKKSSGFLIDTKDIKATWENVVEFIKWYNKCQKEK